MVNYHAFHHTTIGYSHVLKGTCCEDASSSINDGDIHIAVVSDGHGDPACFRSQLGSQFAVEIATEKLLSFAKNIREQGWEEQLFDQMQRERLLRQLIRSIIGNWNIKIAENLEEQPITEEEFAASRDYETHYRAGEELPHIFGCTLVALLVTDRYLLALQQGDGRCVVVHGNCTADQPVPWDSRCVGNICTSLCHADAIESCRYYVADLHRDPVVASFVLSDGIEDSLDSQEDVNAFVCNTASILLQEGREKLLEQLETYLPKMSETGSADDMSLAGIVNMDTQEAVVKWLELMYVLSNHRAVQRNASGKAGSMVRKQDYLKAELDRTQTEYEQVSCELQENLSLMERMKLELRRIINARDDQTLMLETIGHKRDKAKAEYEAYSQKRQEFVDKALAAEADIRQTMQELQNLISSLPTGQPEEMQYEQPDWEFSEAIVWEEEEQSHETCVSETEMESGTEDQLDDNAIIEDEQEDNQELDDFC